VNVPRGVHLAEADASKRLFRIKMIKNDASARTRTRQQSIIKLENELIAVE